MSSNRLKRMSKIPFILLTVSAMSLFSCRQVQQTDSKDDRMLLTDSLARKVSVDTVKMENVSSLLNLSGKVTFDQENVVEIFPMFGGNVTDVYVELGDFVRKGELLAAIKSSEVADYEKQQKEAESKLFIAQKNLDVANDMNQSGLMSQRDILVAEQELKNAKAESKKINEVFSIYNIGNNSQYTIKSPVSGFVVQKNINREMQLRSDNSTEIFIISGLSDVWILANVYESDISKVKAGNQVYITTPAYPDRTFNGSIDKVYNILDEESKTMSVRIKLKNDDYLLKPGMFARVKVTCGSETSLAPCVSQHALIFDSGKNYVVVVGKDKELAIREVSIKEQFDNRIAIAEGLQPGERVIGNNSLLIYSALKQR